MLPTAACASLRPVSRDKMGDNNFNDLREQFRSRRLDLKGERLSLTFLVRLNPETETPPGDIVARLFVPSELHGKNISVLVVLHDPRTTNSMPDDDTEAGFLNLCGKAGELIPHREAARLDEWIPEDVVRICGRSVARWLAWLFDSRKLKPEGDQWGVCDFTVPDVFKVSAELLERFNEVSEDFVFRPDGDGYEIVFGKSGHVSAVRCKGLHQIHRLIGTPMVPVLMTELEGSSLDDPHSRQDIADQATLKGVAAKLREAKSELERATASRDSDNVEVGHCRQEVEKWEDELGKLLGIRGQVRDLNNPYDKKRPKIWGTIKTANQRLRDSGHSELADHLDGSIESERAWFFYVPKLNPIPNWKKKKKDASLRR